MSLAQPKADIFCEPLDEVSLAETVWCMNLHVPFHLSDGSVSSPDLPDHRPSSDSDMAGEPMRSYTFYDLPCLDGVAS